VIFPYDDLDGDVEEMLEILAKPKPSGDPYIIRYALRGKKYIQIVKFTEHQKPHHTEKKSKIPSPVLLNGEGTVKEPSINGKSPEGKNKNKNKNKKKKKNYGEGECEGKGIPAPAVVDGTPPAPISRKRGTSKAVSKEEMETFVKAVQKRREWLGIVDD
jgi:hypothetical protein